MWCALLCVCWCERVCEGVCESMPRVCLTALTITTINLNKPKRQFASDIAHKSWRLQSEGGQRQRQQLLRHLIMAFEINTCPSTHTHTPSWANTCGRDPKASSSPWASACRSVVSVYVVVVVSSHVFGAAVDIWLGPELCTTSAHCSGQQSALLFC